MFALTLKSRNPKTGPIPVSTSTRATCPTSCPFMGQGCYADNYPLRGRWDEVTAGTRGTDWTGFVASVAALPAGTLWRHNQAGDLPGTGDRINSRELAALVAANRGKRGFTYTHKPMTTKANRNAVKRANAAGFAINLSANNLAEADKLSELGIAPVVVVLDAKDGERHDMVTPGGRKVATCPATYRDDVTCASCQLCQRQDRKVIVGFPAHGNQYARAAVVARNG